MKMKGPTREELEILIRESPEAYIDLIMALYDKIEEQAALPEKQAAIIEEQTKTIQALEARLNQNSDNSSLPPSKDRYKVKRKKTDNTKKRKTKKKEKNHRSKMVQNPDQ